MNLKFGGKIFTIPAIAYYINALDGSMVSSVGELRELHKKFSQSLRVLPENSFDWKFLKVGSQLKFIVL